MSREIVAFIFARGGSKGLPGKNLRTIGGRSLVARAVECGRRAPSITRVMVSTDDEAIAAEAERAGAEIPFMRPAELATDTAAEWLSWQHAIRSLRDTGVDLELLVALPATAPLRDVDDVERSIAKALATDADVVLTVTPAARSPYFTMVQLAEDDHATLLLRGEQAIHRRQDAPPVFEITPVAYVARPDYVLRSGSMFEGHVKAVVVPPERSVDIDTELDLALATVLVERQQR